MRKLFISFTTVMAAFSAMAQSTIRVEAPNIVGLDEQFNVTFIIEGDSKVSGIQWSCGDDFQLVWGPQKGSSTVIQNINGKSTRSSQSTFTYILSPKKTGKFTLSPATVKIGGKSLTSNSVTVEVLANGASSGSGSQSSSSGSSSSGSSSGSSSRGNASGDISSDDLFMRLSLSRTSVVVGEPITAVLKLYQRVDIAGFEDAKFPTFDGFWSQETDAPSSIQFQRESFNDKIYNTAVIRRYVLIPQQVGTVRIDPAELVCLVNVRVPSRSSSIFDSFFDDDYRTVRKRITTSPVNVSVKPLPSNAPSSYGGGVGKFKISARLSKDSLKTHEASSLLITVSGNGNVALLESPSVKFPADFEVYDTKTTQNTDKSGTSGSKTFEYPFIPRSYGDFTIEPVEYSFYDVDAGKYVTLSTQPIEISVAKGAAPAQSQAPAVDRKGVKNVGEDIRYIETKTPQLTSGSGFFIGKALYWVLLALLALLGASAFFLLRRFAARRADVVGARNRGATRMAKKRLKLSGDFLQKNLYSAFYEELHKALLGFASDKLNIGAEDLNKDTISERFIQSGVKEETAERFSALLDACEFARYSPDAGHEAMNAHYEEAVNVISTIDATMKGKKKTSAPAAVGILILALAFPSVSKAADTSYPDSLWNKGEKAYEAGKWSEAAKAWEKIASVGIVSDAVYYNIGNAYFKDGNYASAILNYERALKVDPSNSDARFNLEFAKGFVQDKIDPVPEFILKSWARKASYAMSSNSWAVLSLILFAGMAALVLLFLLSPSAAARKTGFYGAIVFFLIFIFSVVSALWQRKEYMSSDQAVVMAPVTTVKSSPSGESAKDLFILHEGTEVRLLDEVGLWNNVSLPDGRQGWIKKEDIEVI